MGEAETGRVFRGIEYEPWPSQERFHECRARFKAFSGPVGSGKSSGLAHEGIRLSYVNRGLLGLIGAPTYRMLHDVTERSVFTVLEDNNIPYRRKRSEDALVLLDNNSEIIFRSTEDPERLIGTNLAWFGLDELSYTPEGSFQRLQARLREPRATELVGFGVCTPAGLNWVYDRFKGDKKNDDYEIIEAAPGENKALPADFYDTLAKSYDERFYRQEVLGEFLSLQSGTVYYAFDRSKHLNAGIQYDPGARLTWSLDFNIDPMSSVVGQLKDYAPHAHLQRAKTRRLEILDEICLRDANVHLACQRFCEVTEKYIRSTGRRMQVSVYGDPAGNSRNHAGKTDWQMVREYFTHKPEYELILHVSSAHPQVRDRVNAVNGALYSSTGEIKITIHPQCTTLIRDLERVMWAKDSHGNAVGDISKKDPSLSHTSDALGYLVEQEFSIKRSGSGFMNQRLV
jgi:phage terminase large subunit